MAAKSAFSIVGLAHKLCLAFEAQGFTPELLNALAESPHILAELRNVQRGYSEIKPITYVIDCDAKPFVPDELEVFEHMPGGVVVWDPTKICLFLSERQKCGALVVGNKLRKELARSPTMNANVLSFLLKNPHLIPEDWKYDERGNTRYIFFWGTIYRDVSGQLCVPYLCWNSSVWVQNYHRLKYVFTYIHPAAMYVH